MMEDAGWKRSTTTKQRRSCAPRFADEFEDNKTISENIEHAIDSSYDRYSHS
jgi:hypothetical protein